MYLGPDDYCPKCGVKIKLHQGPPCLMTKVLSTETQLMKQREDLYKKNQDLEDIISALMDSEVESVKELVIERAVNKELKKKVADLTYELLHLDPKYNLD